MVQHGKPLFGSGDHDKIPHGKPLLGTGDHDRVEHGQHLVGASHHGPEFDDEYKMKELKSMKQSQEELKKLQSLGAFHDFMTFHNKSYATQEEYKYRYGVFKQNMKKVQFLQETELGTGQYGATAVQTSQKQNSRKTSW